MKRRSMPRCAPALLALSCLFISAAAAGDDWLPVNKSKPKRGARPALSHASRAQGLRITLEAPGAYRKRVRTGPGAFDQLRIPGCGATAAGEGLPELPFKGFFVEVPFGVDIRARLVSDKTVSLGRGFRVLPLQPPQPDSPGAADPPFEIDEAAYSENRSFPSEPVAVSEPGVIRGRRVVFVQVFPLSYNPVTTELRALVSPEVTIDYTGIPSLADAKRRRRLRSRQWERFAEGLILNYGPSGDEADGEQPGLGARRLELDSGADLSEDDAADYLIIVADALYDEVLPLAEWKHKKGYVTRVVPMSDVGTTSNDVEAYIQNAYDAWDPAPSYVLLAGDHGDIPAAYYSGTLSCYSDLSFACTDGSDYYPDLTLGRIPVQTEAECTTVVDKLLAYDRTPDTGDWYDDFLSAGYFQDSNDNNGYADRWFMETTATVRDFLRDTAGYTTHTAWTTSYYPLQHSTFHYRSSSYPHRFSYADPVPADIVSTWTSASQSTTDVTTTINNGVGLVQHRDHGSETGWGDPPYSTGNISSLSNGAMTPVVFSINCQSGTFTRASGDCFCEAFLKKESGGCVGIVGASRNSYSGYNDLLVHGTYTSFWPAYDTSHTDATYPISTRPAEALNYGKYYMLVYEGTGSYTEGEFYMFHYFGDPEMMLRTTTPASLSVDHPAAIYIGAAGIVTVTVTAGGSPVEYALVAISCDDAPADYWTAETGASGEAVFPGLTASVVADYNIVVTAQDCAPYEGTIIGITGPDGIVAIESTTYSCSDVVAITVCDTDLQGAGTQDVDMASSNGDTETVTLAETGADTGIFTGTITLSPDPVSIGDGFLQTDQWEQVTATYIDADDGAGGIDIPKTDDALTDCDSPVISVVTVSGVDESSATVSWTTGEDATGVVRFGTDPDDLSLSSDETTYGTTHSVTLGELSAGTRYYLDLVCTDAVDNVTMDTNGGAHYAFTTDTLVGYYEDFEDGELGGGWAAESSTSEGRVRVTGDHEPYEGAYHIVMDRYPSGAYNTNDLTLYADLSAIASDVELTYRYKEFSDEDHIYDGVSLSNDGETFTQVQSHNGGSQEWTGYVIDLDDAAAGAGLTLDDPVYIRWTQYDNYAAETDGIALDNILAGTFIATDTDGDGTPDNGDDDDDDDGLSDIEEVRDHGTDPASADTDGDGLQDGDEVLTYGTSATEADSDGDGLDDGDEILTYNTSATEADSDGDNCSDLLEVSCGGASMALDPDLQPDGLSISFQPSGAQRPDGYAPAYDNSYGGARGYGWVD